MPSTSVSMKTLKKYYKMYNSEWANWPTKVSIYIHSIAVVVFGTGVYDFY